MFRVIGRTYLFTALFSFSLITNALPTDTLRISDSDDFRCIENQALYFLDPTGKLSSDDVVNKGVFTSYQQTKFSSRDSAVWIIFTIFNDQGFDDHFYFNGKLFDFITVYEINHQNIAQFVTRSGYKIPWREKPVKEFDANVSFIVPKKTTKTFLVHLESTSYSSLQLTKFFSEQCISLYNEESFRRNYAISRYPLYFFVGALFIMFLYNFSISIYSQFKEFFLFALYNLSFALAMIMLTTQHIELGIATDFLIERKFRWVFLPCIAWSYYSFSVKFLNLAVYYPKWTKYLNLSHIVFPMTIFLLIGDQYVAAYFLFFPFVLFTFSTVLVLAILLFFKGINTNFFLLGNALVIAVGVIHGLSIEGIVSLQFSAFSFFTGVLAEIVILSFAVARKFTLSHRERLKMNYENKVQAELLRIEKERKEELERELDAKSRSLTASSIQWLTTNEQLGKLEEKLVETFEKSDQKGIKKLVKQINEIKNFDEQWKTVKLHFESVHPGFFTRIEEHFPFLSQNDQKLCAFMKMKLSNKEIATILNVTKEAVEQSKRRMRKKLNLTSDEDILAHLEGQMI